MVAKYVKLARPTTESWLRLTSSVLKSFRPYVTGEAVARDRDAHAVGLRQHLSQNSDLQLQGSTSVFPYVLEIYSYGK